MTTDISQPNIGEKIEMIILDSPKNKYTSQILDILDENTYIISGPIKRSTIISIKNKSMVEINYYKEGVGKFNFKALVIGKVIPGVYKLKVERVGNIIKIQERNFFRLSSLLKVIKRFEIQDEYGKKIIEEICLTKDISGGGVSIFSNYKHESNEKLLLTMNIDDNEINLLGDVVRVFDSSNKDYNYEIAVKFVNINNLERDAIIKFIFEQQRELRKKGMI